jgi:hypothetical protein
MTDAAAPAEPARSESALASVVADGTRKLRRLETTYELVDSLVLAPGLAVDRVLQPLDHRLQRIDPLDQRAQVRRLRARSAPGEEFACAIEMSHGASAALPGLPGRGAPGGWRARSVVGSLEASLSGRPLEPALGLDELGAAIGGGSRPLRRAGDCALWRRHGDAPLAPSSESTVRTVKERAPARGSVELSDSPDAPPGGVRPCVRGTFAARARGPRARRAPRRGPPQWSRTRAAGPRSADARAGMCGTGAWAVLRSSRRGCS